MHAVKSGRWSDPATWGGVLPGAEDVANTAGHVVTVDTDAAVLRLDTAGGGYFVTDGTVRFVVVEAAAPAGEPGSYVVGVGDGSDVEWHGPVVGGAESLRHGILVAGGVLTIHGDVTGGPVPNSFGVWQIGGTVTVHGALHPDGAEAIHSDPGCDLRLDAVIPLGPVPAFTGTTPTLIKGDYLTAYAPGDDEVVLAAGRKLPAAVQSWPPRR